MSAYLCRSARRRRTHKRRRPQRRSEVWGAAAPFLPRCLPKQVVPAPFLTRPKLAQPQRWCACDALLDGVLFRFDASVSGVGGLDRLLREEEASGRYPSSLFWNKAAGWRGAAPCSCSLAVGRPRPVRGGRVLEFQSPQDTFQSRPVVVGAPPWQCFARAAPPPALWWARCTCLATPAQTNDQAGPRSWLGCLHLFCIVSLVVVVGGRLCCLLCSLGREAHRPQGPGAGHDWSVSAVDLRLHVSPCKRTITPVALNRELES